MSVMRRSVLVVAVVGATVIGGGFASAAGGASHALRFRVIETRGLEVREITASGAATTWEVSVEGLGGWLVAGAGRLAPSTSLELRPGATWLPAGHALEVDPGSSTVGVRLVSETTTAPDPGRTLTFTLSAS